MRILYDSKNPLFKKPFGTIKRGEECEINIHIPKSCQTKTAQLKIFKENGGPFAAFFLKYQREYEEYEIFNVRFCIEETGLYFYCFNIETQNESFDLFKQGYDMTNISKGDMWQLSCIDENFKTPKRFYGNVMYQIFPDRFFKYGETNLEGKLEPYFVHKSTKDIPEYAPDNKGEVQNNDFFGGNLKGIEKKLGYLKRLGVGTIYLNPIFKAYSNHRYDTADYKKIDEMLGNEEDFKSLVKKAHSFNIKIILDGVFSHTGSNSVYFDKNNIFGNGAYHNENSPYKEWFQFKNYPNEYTSWWGIETLPCVEEMNEGFRNYIINGEDSVIEHYLKLGADGFRLDVADELPDEFIKEIRAKMKEVNPEALLIGEVWEDASNKVSYNRRREYFLGNELDSVMNYPFRDAIIDFVLNLDSEKLRDTVMTICENYPSEVVCVLMNMLSTHDTPRLLSLLSAVKPPEKKSERAIFKLSKQQLEIATERLKVATFLQFTLPGMPCIYYGDEILTEGFEDPFCRSYFDWEKEKGSVTRKFFERLSFVKNKSDILKFGNTQIEILGKGAVKITREYRGRKMCAYVNCSSSVISAPCKRILVSQNAEKQKNTINIFKNGFALVV